MIFFLISILIEDINSFYYLHYRKNSLYCLFKKLFSSILWRVFFFLEILAIMTFNLPVFITAVMTSSCSYFILEIVRKYKRFIILFFFFIIISKGFFFQKIRKRNPKPNSRSHPNPHSNSNSNSNSNQRYESVEMEHLISEEN